MGCRVHGPGCQVSWGWDPAHTDSARPYTLDELDKRRTCPHRYAYPSTEEYLQGFHLWRALRRDQHLNAEEAEAHLEALRERLEELSGRPLYFP